MTEVVVDEIAFKRFVLEMCGRRLPATAHPDYIRGGYDALTEHSTLDIGSYQAAFEGIVAGAWVARLGSVELPPPHPDPEVFDAVTFAAPETPEEWVLRREHEETLLRAITALPIQQRMALRLRLDGETLGSIGEHMGLSPERARQILEDAVHGVEAALRSPRPLTGQRRSRSSKRIARRERGSG